MMTVSVDAAHDLVPVSRSFSSHTAKWQRFQTIINEPVLKVAKAVGDAEGSHPYMQQYSHVYHQRLQMLKPRCWESFDRDSECGAEDVKKVERVLDLTEGSISAVVGTVVRETGDDGTTLCLHSQCRACDTLFLEDESGRVKLQVDKQYSYPTGIVVAAKGRVGTDGVLHVTKMFSPALPDVAPSSADAPSASELKNHDSATPHLLILSGLYCGNPEVSSLPRDLLVAFLQGRFGADKAKNISHIILAGGLAGTDPAAVKELDGFCMSLASAGIPLDVLPGKDDPTTANWPQRPFHRSLLQKAENNLSKMISRTPNPYAAMHADKYVVGTDGTNVVDLARHVVKEIARETEMDDGVDMPALYAPLSHLESLQQTLKWCHLCPTGPDSVPTAPHVAQDPMVLNELCPSLYFCGNADMFATSLCNDDMTRLVCVPKFSESGEGVLVNLETLDVELLRFAQ
jgi:DNA polymerase delta subunit 2